MYDEKKAFGIAVRQRLIELDMSQRELAKKIGSSENYIWHITHGRRAGTKYKKKIIDILKITN